MSQKGYILLPLIFVVVLIGFVTYFIFKSSIVNKNIPKNESKSSVVNNITQSVSPTGILNKGREGFIEGKITLEYNIPEFPNLKDEINILVSEKGENENNYFSAVNCEKDEDNCIWLTSEKNNTRIFSYRLTLDGGSDALRAGEKYKAYVSIRHYNDNGNICGTQSEKIRVEIPSSGIKIQNFDLQACSNH